MTTDDDRRLREILDDRLGPDGTDLLLTRLPERPVSDFATRDDVQAMAMVLRGEMAELRGEMAELRGELRGEMADLRSELRTELAAGFVAQQRVMVTTSLASTVGTATLVLAAVGLT
ncbi:MAG: hypothetical protein AAGA17_19245 [Actinomycetota bacterium]